MSVGTDSLIIIARSLAGDPDGTTFSDDRVLTAVVTGALIASNDFPFDTVYTFDFINNTISPDPISDNIAMALFGLKAACILSTNQMQSAVGNGIRVKDGSSAVDTTAGFQGYKTILELGPCGAYNTLSKELRFSQGSGKGQAILSPYSGNSNTGWGLGIGFSHVMGFYDSFIAF